MKKYKLYLIYILCISMLTSCSDSWNETYSDTAFEALVAGDLTVNKESIEFSENAANAQITITTTGFWTVKTSANWVKLSDSKGKNNGSLSVSVEANNNTNAREATLVISNGKVSKSVIVSQKGVELPNITGVVVSNISTHNAECTFSFSSAYLDITEYGICYSKTSNLPTISNAQVLKRDDSRKTGNPSFALTGLDSKTTYYVRSFIVTALGTQYGEVAQFTTPASSPNEDDNKTPQNN